MKIGNSNKRLRTFSLALRLQLTLIADGGTSGMGRYDGGRNDGLIPLPLYYKIYIEISHFNTNFDK